MSSIRNLATAAMLLLAAGAQAQVTITMGDVPATVGDSFTYKYTIGIAPITVGDPGGPQTWDFDTTTYTGDLTNLAVVDLAATPFDTIFPSAQLVYRGTGLGGDQSSFVFHWLGEDALTRIGTGNQLTDTITSVVYDPVELVFPMPLGYETEFWTDWGYTNDMGMIVSITHTWGMHRVDAYGTANTPAGSFDVLRLNGYDTTTTETWLNDTLLHADTFGYRIYIWYAPRVGIVAFATGPENDTSLIFTETDCYRVLVATQVGIAEGGAHAPARLGVAPNPFAAGTRIAFSVERPGRVTVRVRDAAGRTVRTLADRVMPAGAGELRWDGRDDAGRRVAPGVYVCTANGPGLTAARRLLFTD